MAQVTGPNGRHGQRSCLLSSDQNIQACTKGTNEWELCLSFAWPTKNRDMSIQHVLIQGIHLPHSNRTFKQAACFDVSSAKLSRLLLGVHCCISRSSTPPTFSQISGTNTPWQWYLQQGNGGRKEEGVAFPLKETAILQYDQFTYLWKELNHMLSSYIEALKDDIFVYLFVVNKYFFSFCLRGK